MSDETPRELTEQEMGDIQHRSLLSGEGAVFATLSVDERDSLLHMARRGARAAWCPDCDKGIRGGDPCRTCHGLGRVLSDLEAALFARVETAETLVSGARAAMAARLTDDVLDAAYTIGTSEYHEHGRSLEPCNAMRRVLLDALTGAGAGSE